MQDAKNETRPCRYIRTKAFAMNKAANLHFIEKQVNTEHYWCLRTMQVIGPDDTPVLPEECCRSRGCYQKMPEKLEF